MEKLIPRIRLKMKARVICERQVKAFRRFLPAQKKLMQDALEFDEIRDLSEEPIKFYFRSSEADILSKVFLYAKKILFQ